MKKMLNNKWLVIGALLLLFVFVILVSFHFFQKEEKGEETIIDPIVFPSDDELEFINSTTLSKEELESIVKLKKEELQSLFYDSYVYKLQDIDKTKTDEEDEKYTVFDEQFLEKLNKLVTEEIYSTVFNKMTLLKNDNNHTFYMMEKNAFDSIYLDSAIAKINVTSTSFRLISASDDKINASVTNCKDENCNSYESYPLELVLMNDDWKINVFER